MLNYGQNAKFNPRRQVSLNRYKGILETEDGIQKMILCSSSLSYQPCYKNI
jgi:hypothetical protein